MRTRHRIPTIFNLSMVDVLCCALGCVILLWLLNFREAKERLVKAGQVSIQLQDVEKQLLISQQSLQTTRELLASTTHELETTGQWAAVLAAHRDNLAIERENLDKDLQSARGQLTQLTRRLDEVTQQKANVDAELTLLTRALADVRKQKATSDAQLASMNRSLNDLQKQKNALDLLLAERDTQLTDATTAKQNAEKRLTSLEDLLKQKDTQFTAAAQAADDLARRIRDTEAQNLQLKRMAGMIPGLQAEAKLYRDKLAAAEARGLTLESELLLSRKQLDETLKNLQNLETSKDTVAKQVMDRARDLVEARRRISELEGDKKFLMEVVNRARQAADNRFAGVVLTGRRVVFIIDISGSMGMLDYNTPAPGKWEGVCDTVAKVMRSLPDLEKYQVIIFSSKATFLLGQENDWFDFDPQISPDQVFKALLATKPVGHTNIYAAMDAAFRFRAKGMDTVYFFSDGLPSMGEGLTPEQARTLTENQRVAVMSQYVRQTLLNNWNRSIPGQQRVRIHSIGFYYESPDLGAFLWALSRENDGSFVGMSRP
ncbi:MAG: VWA domain-containing protein [Gemmataceae bacterium]